MSDLDAITGVSREQFRVQYDEWSHALDRTAYYDEHFDYYYDVRLKGVPRSVFEKAARKIAAHAAKHFYPEILSELARRKGEGRFVMLISKSPEQAVAEIARSLGADASWGWQFNFDDDNRYLNQYAYPSGESDKAFIIKRFVDTHQLLLDGLLPMAIPWETFPCSASSPLPLL